MTIYIQIYKNYEYDDKNFDIKKTSYSPSNKTQISF